jgi:putative phage-type endonuclease
MKIITHEQGSDAWKTWRKGLLTATDAAMLLGESPYVTAYQCWQRKVGLLPEVEVTAPMRRGTRDEPIARDLFNRQYVLPSGAEDAWLPECIESEKYPFLGASLDGISDTGESILEIKSTNFHDSPDSIPKFHWIQMQHQMLCGDGTIDMCYYVRYWEGQINVQRVYRDDEWAKDYIPKATQFWEHVALMEPAPLSEKDYRDMNDNEEWRDYAADYEHIVTKIKKLENEKERIRQELIKLSDKTNCSGGGIRIFKKITKGRVDHDLIPELKDIDLDKYRKQPSIVWTITLDKN